MTHQITKIEEEIQANLCLKVLHAAIDSYIKSKVYPKGTVELATYDVAQYLEDYAKTLIQDAKISEVLRLEPCD